MCGRTVSTLNHNQLRRACTYNNRQGRRMRPGWRNRGPQGGGGAGGGGGGGGGGTRRAAMAPSQKGSSTKPQVHHAQPSEKISKKYYPSFNIAPTRSTPVLISSRHFATKTTVPSTEPQPAAPSDEREIVPMVWGLVPSWHKGKAKDMAYKMNNCRGEGMLEKASFKRPFEKGQRCVVLVDGFYEWKTDKKKQKQPYFIYFSQDSPPTDLSLSSEKEGEGEGASWSEEGGEDEEVVEEATEVSEGDPGWTGHRLLTMAGLFDKWYPPQSDEPIYTYSVITVAADKSLSWLHHRMPAVLDGDKEIQDWLDFGSIEANKKAQSLISARSCLSWHPVTKAVGNIRYKDPDCIKPIELGKPELPKKPSGSSKFMSSWLAKGSKATDSKSEIKGEGGGGATGVKKEAAQKQKTAKGQLTKWLVKKEVKKEEGMKKEEMEEEEMMKRKMKREMEEEGGRVKQEQPSPKRLRTY